MNLLCVAGFLGSGKTTMLLALARRMTEASLSLAVVENEIGEVGVDGDVVRGHALPVLELFGGCICCTLRTGLLSTLRALEAQYRPDWAIVEPTGLAAPGDIVTTIREFMPDIGEIRVLTLVDAERWEILREVVEPLITAQIESADVIAVTKSDLVDHASLESVIVAVRCLSAEAPIVSVAAPVGTGVQTLYETLFP